MSVDLWPVFEDGHKHGLGVEGITLFRAYEDLDAIAMAAGRMPLSAFDAHADVPDEVIEQRPKRRKTDQTSPASRSCGTTPLMRWQPWM
jgi:hypothetical protein